MTASTSFRGKPSDISYVSGLENDVMAEWRRRSRALIYQRDPEAWMADVLGRRWWSTQREIAWSFVENQFTIVKSCNGVGKTQLAGDLTSWAVSVFPPLETIALVSAPVRSQIDENLFRYLRENYRIAEERGKKLIGEITRWPKWMIDTPYAKDLVLPKRPADSNLLSSFQGIHQDYVFVVLDEAGGLAEDFFIGANAVTTNKNASILAIGNPDQRNTPFQRRFTDRVAFSDWHPFTISAYDSPNFTGEMIYPEDPELDAKVKSRLVQVSWAEMMKRSASPAVVAAKVYGEFPDEDSNTFFPQSVINRAWDLWSTLEPAPDDFATLGVDTAWRGDDKNVIYYNLGGRIERIDRWGKEEGEGAVEHMAVARRVHRHAMDRGVHEVRIDATGTGSGVYSLLRTEPEFVGRTYLLIGVMGAQRSPNPNRWLNARAWHYDTFRQGMADGRIALDPQNAELRTDMEVQTFKYTLRQQLQITGKDELRKDLKHSPDDLDAAIYSAIDMTAFTQGPAAGMEPGEQVLVDPWEWADVEPAGLPI